MGKVINFKKSERDSKKIPKRPVKGSEQIKDYYDELIGGCDRYAVRTTLDFLGIKIEGVND